MATEYKTARNIFEAHAGIFREANNKVWISGRLACEFEFNHEIKGEKFFSNRVMIERLSGEYDSIPVLVSDRLIDTNETLAGKLVEIAGQFRSYNKRNGDEGKSRLILNVFALEINIVDDEFDLTEEINTNQIYLDGYLCKTPSYRETPLGREICDLLVAVNRAYGKSDYIPCIAWGRNARYVAGCSVGDRLIIKGRVQSRVYEKNGVPKEAFEVSAAWLYINK